jgi:hypothetical protein
MQRVAVIQLGNRALAGDGGGEAASETRIEQVNVGCKKVTPMKGITSPQTAAVTAAARMLALGSCMLTHIVVK